MDYQYSFDHDLTYFSSESLNFFNLLDMNRASPLLQDQYNFSDLGFPYYDPIDEDLIFWNFCDDLDHLLSLSYNFNDNHSVESNGNFGSGCEAKVSAASSGGAAGGHGGGRRSRPLELEEIEMHFEMPIAMAAEKMQVGLTLMQNVKEMGLNEEIEMLEEQKRMIKKMPEMELTKRTRNLRQACFKANYKKRRSHLANL